MQVIKRYGIGRSSTSAYQALPGYQVGLFGTWSFQVTHHTRIFFRNVSLFKRISKTEEQKLHESLFYKFESLTPGRYISFLSRLISGGIPALRL